MSESIRVFPTPKAAKQFVAATRASPGCVAYGAQNSFNRVFMQYPSPPPLPTFAATVERAGTTTTGSFEGTSAAAPLSGVAAVITWSNYVAEAAIRIAVPKPGELAALSQSVLSSASYTARAATGAATNPKLVPGGRRGRGGVPREPVERALRVRARRPCRCPDEPAELRADDRGLRRLRRERRRAHVCRPGHHDARRRPARDRRVSEAGRRRPLPELLPRSLDLSVRPLQERARGRIDRRRPAHPEARGGAPAKRSGARRPSRTSRRSREPTAPNWARRRSRWSRCETVPRPCLAQLVSPDPNADIKTALAGLQRDLGSALAQK